MRFGKEATEENADDSTAARYQASRFIFVALSTLLFAAFAFQFWYHATRTSATVDEPVHILAGHRHWQCGDFGINPEHPPLLKLLAAAPLNSRNLIEPNWECGSKMTSKFDSFSFGNSFLADNGVDDIVIPTRLASAVMSLLLALFVFLAAREMFGRSEAVTALALLAFEPNLIAHGSIVTTDMVLTTTAFVAVYALYRFQKNQSWSRFLVVGLAFGLLLAAKHFGGNLHTDFVRAFNRRRIYFSSTGKPTLEAINQKHGFFRRIFSHRFNYSVGILWFSIPFDSDRNRGHSFSCRLYQRKRSSRNGRIFFRENC